MTIPVYFRSEMHNPLSALRFAPVLESYCLYCGSAVLEERLKEVHTVETFKGISNELKSSPNMDTVTPVVFL